MYPNLGAEKILSAKSNKASFVPSSTTMQHHNDAIILKKDETKSSSSEILNYIEVSEIKTFLAPLPLIGILQSGSVLYFPPAALLVS